MEKPDGTPRKLLDSSLLNRLGWKAAISLEKGVQHSYADYVERVAKHVV